MNLSHYSNPPPVEPFFPESEVSFRPTLLSMVRKETSDSEKKYFKILEFLIER
jgi:hypothetical protein